MAHGTDPSDLPTEELPVRERTPDRVGPYTLLRELGEGGMGVVYEARQDRPLRRRVALKLIKRGMDTAKVVARFDSERQALALMDHPNIAKVLDADETDDGRPYFVMELVRGAPLTEYSDAQRLTIRERLELFVEACAAVHHAHQRGVIHRDLKPSNVLVDRHDGKHVPKIIDFGIAKATTPQLTGQSLTEFGQFIGTPEYMSPEQASIDCQDIDVRTDVYSLGVVLYELLSGSKPHVKRGTSGLDELRRRIRTEDPGRPSSRITSADDSKSISESRQAETRELVQLLRGDLDWIVLKALEKERDRRYDSVAELAADLRRHLDDRPVGASPPSLFYRAGKFVRRHRTHVAFTVAVSILVAGLMVAVGFILMQERRIRRLTEGLQPGEQEVLLAGIEHLAGDEFDRVKETVGRLEGADRTATQRPVEVLSALDLRPGDRVADIGAGSGFFTVPIARIVEPHGEVWAVDVDGVMVDFLKKRLLLEDIGNVRVAKVPTDDPQLPDHAIDAVLLVDTYRYLENRTQYAEKLRTALAPGGRVIIIDEVPDALDSTESSSVARAVVDAEMGAAGFEPVKSHDMLSNQYFVEYVVR